jgi:tol-pal system protein YbgF
MLHESRIETLFHGVRRPPRVAVILLVAFLMSVPSWGCVTVAEHRKLERRVLDLKRTQGGNPARQQLADLAAEVDDLRSAIRELTGKLEETGLIARQSLEEARKARREAAAAGSIDAGAAPEASGPGDGASARDAAAAAAVARAGEDIALSDELKSYQAGIAAWRSQNYPSCIDRFRGFLQTYASSSRADDAAFWIADCHYKQGEFKNAVLRFDDVVRNYPTGNRAPDALYRQGESLLKLGPGFREAARRAFERVLKEYPDSARAPEAKRQLEAVG